MTRLAHAPITRGNILLRGLWEVTWVALYRPSPRVFHAWRRMLLRLFGAHIERGARPHPRTRIWAPWNLEMGADSCLGDDVDCYTVARIRLGARATVSQYSYLCTASHDYLDPAHPTVAAPIVIEDDAWVAADVFVGPGVTVGAGAVIAARSTVTRDVLPWTVVAGSPPRMIRQRILRSPTTPQPDHA